MNSHEYAKRMKEIAEFLLARPEFPMAHGPMIFHTYYEKEPFVAAVKALGSGKKTHTTGMYPEVQFVSTLCPEINIAIPRDKVCRLVREAEYDCEPFLSPEEDAALVSEPA